MKTVVEQQFQTPSCTHAIIRTVSWLQQLAASPQLIKMNQIHHLLVLWAWFITFLCNFLSFSQPVFLAAVNSELSVCFPSSCVLVFVAWPRCILLILHISALVILWYFLHSRKICAEFCRLRPGVVICLALTVLVISATLTVLFSPQQVSL